MAKDTPLYYRNLVIYEVYVRNHGPNGTFAEVEADLARIRSMGVDVVWFMPIHPIGQLNKKGGLGCPYSIQDYRGINPEYGTREDFARLIETAHALGLQGDDRRGLQPHRARLRSWCRSIPSISIRMRKAGPSPPCRSGRM